MSIEYPIIALVGAFLTFYLAKHNRFDSIRASSALTIVAYLFFYVLGFNADLHAVIFFGGTFIGMSSPKRFGVYTIASSSIIFSFLFEYLMPILYGYGGALGLSAFLSVCICHIFILLGVPRSQKPQ